MSVVTLGVDDLDRARTFYERGLGWRRGNVEDEVAFYQLPGFVVALWSRDEQAADAGLPVRPRDEVGTSCGGITLAQNQPDPATVDAVVAEVVAAGGRVTRAAAPTSWGGYSAYVSDPDGHVWEIAFNPAWHVDSDGGTSLGS